MEVSNHPDSILFVAELLPQPAHAVGPNSRIPPHTPTCKQLRDLPLGRTTPYKKCPIKTSNISRMPISEFSQITLKTVSDTPPEVPDILNSSESKKRFAIAIFRSVVLSHYTHRNFRIIHLLETQIAFVYLFALAKSPRLPQKRR